MSDILDFDPEEMPQLPPQEEANRDFAEADSPGIFEGVIFEPYTMEREATALALGLQYGNVREESVLYGKTPVTQEYLDARTEEERTLLEEDGIGLGDEVDVAVGYREMHNDLLIFLWVCTTRKSSDLFKARRQPERYAKQVYALATKYNVHPGSPEAQKLAEMFSEEQARIQKARTRPEKKLVKGEKSAEPIEPPGE